MKKVGKSTRKRLTQSDIKKYSSSEIDHVITKIKTKEARDMFLLVFGILILLVGGSYLVFSSVQKRVQFNTIQIGALKIDYQEMKNGLGDEIFLDSSNSLSNRQGLKTEPYHFNITNTSNERVSYQIQIVDDTDVIEVDRCQKQLIDKSMIQYSLDGVSPRSLDQTGINEYVIADGVLDAKSSTSYSLKMWAKQRIAPYSHYHGKISITILKV